MYALLPPNLLADHRRCAEASDGYRQYAGDILCGYQTPQDALAALREMKTEQRWSAWKPDVPLWATLMAIIELVENTTKPIQPKE